MSEVERAQYATACGTTTGYIKAHLIPKPRRVPRRDLFLALADKSAGAIGYADVFEHFYQVELFRRSSAA